MKTFEEALIAQVTMKPGEADRIEQSGEAASSLRIRNVCESAEEIISSEHARRYLVGLVEVSIANAENETPEQYFDFLMGLAMSAFAVGVRVGAEMEKQEIEEPAQKAGGAA